MSYSKYLDDKLEEFRRCYPAEQGWQIFRAGQSVLGNLPQFIEENPGTSVKTDAAQNIVTETSALRESRQIAPEDLIASVQTLKKQMKTATTGSVELGKSAHPLGFVQVMIE